LAVHQPKILGDEYANGEFASTPQLRGDNQDQPPDPYKLSGTGAPVFEGEGPPKRPGHPIKRS